MFGVCGSSTRAANAWDERGAMPAGVAIDIVRSFGSLASMHAALDRIGMGMPCGIVARFPDRDTADVEAAIAFARHRFPVLQTRLAWPNGRPVLMDAGAAIPVRDRGTGPLLDFAVATDGEPWRYRLIRDGADVWLQAVWLHAVADGLSMLRFLHAVEASLAGASYQPSAREPRRAERRRPLGTWLPGFLLDQQRDYVAMTSRSQAVAGTSWLVVPPATRDHVLGAANAACGGGLGWLAAAAARAFGEQEGQARGDVLLNVPIARGDATALGGFGFGVGSLRFPLRLRAGTPMADLAAEIARRTRRAAATGWDRNLERLLGTDPARHARFARIQAERTADPNITISWKGTHPAIGAHGARDIACFAAAPTLHVSAHADARGLSLSVTSHQSTGQRTLLLQRIADHLGCGDERTTHALDAIGASAGGTARAAAIDQA